MYKVLIKQRKRKGKMETRDTSFNDDCALNSTVETKNISKCWGADSK